MQKFDDIIWIEIHESNDGFINSSTAVALIILLRVVLRVVIIVLRVVLRVVVVVVVVVVVFLLKSTS